MKIVILTSDGLRHKFFANSLSSESDDTLIISESKQTNSENLKLNDTNPIDQHFKLRNKTEESFFPNNSFFIKQTLPIPYKDLNRGDIFQTVHYVDLHPVLLTILTPYVSTGYIETLNMNRH